MYVYIVVVYIVLDVIWKIVLPVNNQFLVRSCVAPFWFFFLCLLVLIIIRVTCEHCFVVNIT